MGKANINDFFNKGKVKGRFFEVYKRKPDHYTEQLCLETQRNPVSTTEEDAKISQEPNGNGA